jgi:hypothetical protein
MRAFTLLLPCFALLAACGGAAAPDEAIGAAQSKWSAHSPTDYAFRIRYGGASPNTVTSVIVKGGQPASQIVESTSAEPVSPAVPYAVPAAMTIDSLFDQLRKSATNGDDVQATYDSTYGFPVSAVMSSKGEGDSFAVSDFHTLDAERVCPAGVGVTNGGCSAAIEGPCSYLNTSCAKAPLQTVICDCMDGTWRCAPLVTDGTAGAPATTCPKQ